MLWVCRTGKKGVFYEKYIKEGYIYIPWEHYSYNFTDYSSREEYKEIVKKEKQEDNPTAISTWAGAIYSFTNEMSIGDRVLIPAPLGRYYTYAEIIGQYEYFDSGKLKHRRKIRIITDNIPRDIFPQDIVFSLGAYRSLFKIRQEKSVTDIINKRKKGNYN